MSCQLPLILYVAAIDTPYLPVQIVAKLVLIWH